MRILANYSCKDGPESFSMTIESFGDVSKEAIDSTADELFSRAKNAVWRQINNPKVAHEETAVSTSRSKGNGNGGNGKDRLATEKQLSVIAGFMNGLTQEGCNKILRHILGEEVGGDISGLTKAEASEVVGRIFSTNKTSLLRAASAAEA